MEDPPTATSDFLKGLNKTTLDGLEDSNMMISELDD